MTQLKKRLQQLEKVQVKRDPHRIAKAMLSDADQDLLEKLGYNKAAFDPSQMAVWFRWESALRGCESGAKVSDSGALRRICAALRRLHERA